MRFAFSRQQTEFSEAVRRVLADTCTAADVRSAFEEPNPRPARWATLARIGVAGLTVPETCGGLGLGMVDLVLILEECGRVALPEPLTATAALAAPGLAEGDPTEPRRPNTRRWLSDIAAGEAVAAVAESQRSDRPLAGAVGADLYVLPSMTDDGVIEVHAVGADDVAVKAVSSLDPTRRLGVVHWAPRSDTCIARGTSAEALMRSTADRAAVAVAAELLGLADTMIALGARYASERHQFGRPIGSFQAVKHLLAGARVALEFARPAVYAAAWHVDEDERASSRMASLAKAYASEAATEAARVSLQVHGALGYTWECDLHLFLKRTWALTEAWGSAADHRSRVLAGLVDDRMAGGDQATT